MKKIAFVLAAAGLMSLAACGSKSPEAAATINNADMVADNMDNMADAMSTNTDAAADNIHDAADNVRSDAKDAAKNM